MAYNVNKSLDGSSAHSTLLFLDEEELEKAERYAEYDGWNLAKLKTAFVEDRMDIEEFEDRVELVLLEAQNPTEKKTLVLDYFDDPYVAAVKSASAPVRGYVNGLTVSDYIPIPSQFEIDNLHGVWRAPMISQPKDQIDWDRWDQVVLSDVIKRDQRAIAVPQNMVKQPERNCPKCRSERYHYNNSIECPNCDWKRD